MKSKKKYCFILIAICAMFMVSGIIYAIMKNADSKESAVTRYKWIEMLGEQFGLREYDDETPYFNDVDEDNPYFCYVQSAVEWGVIEEKDKFNGEKSVTGEFVVQTVMRAIGKYKVQMYLDMDEEPEEDDYLELALESNLIEKNQLNEKLSKKQCREVLDIAEKLNMWILWKDDVVIPTYADNVKELRTQDIVEYNDEMSKILVDVHAQDELSIGDIIIFEEDNTGLKTARRIDEINGGELTVSNPAMEDVFKSLIVSDIATFENEDILDIYQISNNNYGINKDTLLGDVRKEEYKAKTIDTFDFASENEGVAFSVVSEDGKVKIEVENKKTGVSVSTPIDLDVDEDTDIDCTFEITNIDVGVQAIWTPRGGLEYANIMAYAEIGEKVNLSIVSEELKIPLIKCPVPIAGGLASINIQFSLVISAEGEISIETTIPYGTNLYYEKGKGMRNVQMDCTYAKPQINLSAELNISLCPEVALEILKLWEVADIEAEIGASAEAESVIHDTQTCVDISIAFPVITMTASVDPIVLKPVSCEWEIITKDNAKFRHCSHYEKYRDGTAGFVDECTYGKQKGSLQEEIKQEEIKKEQSEFAKYSTCEVPMWLHVYGAFEDKGDCYAVDGSLYIRCAVKKSEFDRLEEGEEFTINDHKYIKGVEKILSTEDEKYEISTCSIYSIDEKRTYFVDYEEESYELFGNNNGSLFYSVNKYDIIDEENLIIEFPENIEVWDYVGDHEYEIAKDAVVSSTYCREKTYTAKECYENNLEIAGLLYRVTPPADDYILKYGQISYVTFNSEGKINSIIFEAFD